MKLDIGSGNVRRADLSGYTTLDANPDMNPDILARVPPIPLPDESVDRIYSSHFLEHLTDGEVAVLMAEIWRVLKVGCEAEFIVPYGLSHRGIQDPTHQSMWCYEKFLYYSPHFANLGYGLENRFSIRALNQTSEQVRAVLVKTATLEPCNCFDCLKEYCDAINRMQEV